MPDLRDPPPLLTRIITCFRQWGHIAQWIERDELFAPQIRWLIVNDATDDPCPPELASRLIARNIRVESVQWNLGRSNARNLGASTVTTEWLEHIDGDDAPLPISPECLTSKANADLILFPVAEFPEGAEIPRSAPARPWKMDTETYWGFLAPTLRPFDPRPATTLWRTACFRKLQGYDARYDGNEDLHLMWKADLAGVSVARWDQPKQAYRVHGYISIRTRKEYMESLRFYVWLRGRCRPEQERPLQLLIGRQVLACARLFVRDIWAFRRDVYAYLRARWSGEFFRTFR